MGEFCLHEQQLNTNAPLMLFKFGYSVRAMGSAALNMAMIALGSADVNYEYGIHAWDIAGTVAFLAL